MREKSMLSDHVTCHPCDLEFEPRNTRDIQSMTKCITQIRSMSAPVSLTIPPVIVNPLGVERHQPLGPIGSRDSMAGVRPEAIWDITEPLRDFCQKKVWSPVFILLSNCKYETLP
jgi:hypothetical protein